MFPSLLSDQGSATFFPDSALPVQFLLLSGVSMVEGLGVSSALRRSSRHNFPAIGNSQTPDWKSGVSGRHPAGPSLPSTREVR